MFVCFLPFFDQYILAKHDLVKGCLQKETHSIEVILEPVLDAGQGENGDVIMTPSLLK